MEVDEVRLSSLLEAQFGLTDPILTLLGGGADPNARTYHCLSKEGIWFVKVSKRLRTGHVVQTKLSRSGILGLVGVRPTKLGESAVRLGELYVRVYDWAEGKNGFEAPLPPEAWEQVGRTLRAVHELDSGCFDCPCEDFAVTGTDELFADIARVPELQILAETYETQIDETLQWVETLAGQCRAMKVSYVLCHSDIHIGNILLGLDGSIHLVDWDEPKIAPRECDLVYFLDGGVLGGQWLADEQAFLEGYGEVEAVPELLNYYRYARMLADLVAYAKEAADACSEAERREACRMFEIQFAPGMPFEMAQRARRRHT